VIRRALEGFIRENRTDVLRGPRDCWRTKNVWAPCDVCGAHPEVVHVPMHGRGFRCAAHCENCNPAAVTHDAVALAAEAVD
jgi:hypothetical protein